MDALIGMHSIPDEAPGRADDNDIVLRHLHRHLRDAFQSAIDASERITLRTTDAAGDAAYSAIRRLDELISAVEAAMEAT